MFNNTFVSNPHFFIVIITSTIVASVLISVSSQKELPRLDLYPVTMTTGMSNSIIRGATRVC
jgi:hypothetical protein